MARVSARFASGALVIGLHILALAALMQLDPVRSALTAAAPLVVRLIVPEKEEPKSPPKPPPEKPRAQRPQEVRQPEKPPITTTIAEAPYVAPVIAPEPVPPIEAPPAPVALAASPAPTPAPVTPPQFNAAYLNNPAPMYPTLSRRTGEEGKVVLRVFVSERGLPAEVQLKTSSGFSRLDGAALETVKQWKFVPARRGDTAIGAWVLVPIAFSLRS